MNGFTLGFDNASGGVLHLPEKVRVTLLALGDVGSTLLTGLRLMGGDVISSIGICDVRPGVAERWEFELNQIQPPDGAALPEEGLDILPRSSTGKLQTLILRGREEDNLAWLEKLHPLFMDSVPLTLEEIFIY